MLKEILYDWDGANLWLFHAINDVRGDALDRFMLVGTHIGSHVFFPYYLAAAACMALVIVGRAMQEDRSFGQALGLAWLGGACRV